MEGSITRPNEQGGGSTDPPNLPSHPPPAAALQPCRATPPVSAIDRFLVGKTQKPATASSSSSFRKRPVVVGDYSCSQSSTGMNGFATGSDQFSHQLPSFDLSFDRSMSGTIPPSDQYFTWSSSALAPPWQDCCSQLQPGVQSFDNGYMIDYSSNRNGTDDCHQYVRCVTNSNFSIRKRPRRSSPKVNNCVNKTKGKWTDEEDSANPNSTGGHLPATHFTPPPDLWLSSFLKAPPPLSCFSDHININNISGPLASSSSFSVDYFDHQDANNFNDGDDDGRDVTVKINPMASADEDIIIQQGGSQDMDLIEMVSAVLKPKPK